MAPADDEVAALAELGRRVTATKKLVLLPVALLTLGAAFGAALLHVSGSLAFPYRLADGSYYINRGTIGMVTILAGAVVFVPGVLFYRVAVRTTIARWRTYAKERCRLDDATIDALAKMFVPAQRQ